MENKSYLIILCIFLLSASLIEGKTHTNYNKRCLCKKTIKKPKMNKIGEIKLYPISAACERIEIVATLKDGKKTICISPEAKQIKEIISGKKTYVINSKGIESYVMIHRTEQ
uniref:Chemokine interleukin-8-like domain-containing protein n=1 Tax=Leptobrachium leishanense TaxID=445787 RepID=A0A8C5LRE3_9ANUR